MIPSVDIHLTLNIYQLIDNEGPGPRAGHCSVVINNRRFLYKYIPCN